MTTPVLTFDTLPTPGQIATALIDRGDVAPALTFLAVWTLAQDAGQPALTLPLATILVRLDQLGLLRAWEEGHVDAALAARLLARDAPWNTPEPRRGRP